MDNHSDQTRPRRLTMRTISTLPALMTLANLLCGFAAIFYASRIDAKAPWGWTPLAFAAMLVFIGMIFDALDGRVARITGQTSEFGAQLDSMADMVTFGVAPAFLVIQLVNIGTPFFGESYPKWNIYFDRTVLLIAGVYVACCALRLARYNIETTDDATESHLYFKGLPSPGAAGTVAGLVLLHQHLLAQQANTIIANITAVGMVTVTFVAAIGMVGPLRYTHVGNRFLRDKAPFNYIAMFAVIGLLLWIIPVWAIAGGFVTYSLSAPVMLVIRKYRKAYDQQSDKPEKDNPTNQTTDNDSHPSDYKFKQES